MSEANGLNIRVHKFFQQKDPVKDDKGKETGEIIVRDYVQYGPPHLMDRQAIIARVDRILKAKPPVAGSKNIAEQQAWQRAEFIRPLYESWRKGEEIPDDGMPLAALNFLDEESASILKRHAIRSVQELSTMPDSVLDRVPLPGMREKRLQARRFLEAQDANKIAAQMAARDDELAELRRQVEALKAGAVDDAEIDENGDRIPKRRGRPPKVTAEHEAA